MLNPTKISWTHDGKNTDGTPISANVEPRFVVYIDGAENFLIPLTWGGQAGSFEYPLSSAGLDEGTHTLTMTVRTSLAESAKPQDIQFTIARIPTSPLDLAVSAA